MLQRRPVSHRHSTPVRSRRFREKNPLSLDSTALDVLTVLQGKSLPGADTKRSVLIRPDSAVLHVPAASFLKPETYADRTVIVTGEFDSCSNTVSLNDAKGIQVY
jgi:hypothetical protein